MNYPLTNSFLFMQNDDWVYYLNVENFLNGNFNLHPITAPTFYVQGFLAYLFSLIFGPAYIPYLTLLVSALCCFILYKILTDPGKLSKIKALSLTLIFAVNPLFIYSAIGFMTDNYLLLFVLLSLRYFLKFEQNRKQWVLYISLLYALLAFGVKQIALFLSLGYGLYFLLKRDIKNSAINFSFFIVNFMIYQFLFPKTQEMTDKGIDISKLINLSGNLKFILLALVYICALLSPMILAFAISKVKDINKNIIKLLIFIVIVTTYFLIKPDSVGFIFFGNSLTYRGFFPGDLNGDKYYLRAFDNIFQIWEILGIFSLGILATFINYKNILKKIDSIPILIIIYFSVVLSISDFYDRYLLPTIALLIIYLGQKFAKNYNKITNFILIGGIASIGFISYNFATEFVISHLYVWHKSTEIVKNGTQQNQINSTRAWNLYFEKNSDKLYEFSYDDQIDGYKKVEEYEIRYPGQFFLNPRIYLHSKD